MSARRLPVYVLLDTSGSMHGEPIQAANEGLRALMGSMRQNPQCLESVWLSIIRFDTKPHLVMDLTSVLEARLRDIECPISGASHLGAALHYLCDKVQSDADSRTSDYKPLLFIITDDRAADEWAFEQALPILHSLGFSKIIACAAGPKADTDQLSDIANIVVSLDTMSSASFKEFFEFVSEEIVVMSKPIQPSTKPKDALRAETWAL